MDIIRPIGASLKTDGGGYFINPCHPDHIQDPWKQAVQDIIELSKKHLGEKLLSVFIRGSVARGTAVSGVSDIDSFTVVKGNRWALDLTWMEPARQVLEQRYTFHGGVEIQCISDQEILDGHLDESIRFTIKTLSTCVYGEDISVLLPIYKLGRYLTDDVHRFKQSVDEVCTTLNQYGLNSPQIKDICRWIMKCFVRTGLSIVLEREKIYSRDLYPCYAAFVKHYPEHQQAMEEALKLAINPVDDKSQITSICLTLGSVLQVEIVKFFPESGCNGIKQKVAKDNP